MPLTLKKNRVDGKKSLFFFGGGVKMTSKTAYKNHQKGFGCLYPGLGNVCDRHQKNQFEMKIMTMIMQTNC